MEPMMRTTSRPTPARPTIVRLGAALFAAALVLAACGSSDSATDTTGSTAASGATTTAAAAATTTAASGTGAELVKVKDNDKLGSILASASGATLYTLTDASGKAVACTGACLGVWPPASAPAGTTAVTGADGVELAVADDASGPIITAGGLPLYTFVRDTDDEDAYGDGLASFGGTWHVVKVGDAGGTTPAASDETTTTRY